MLDFYRLYEENDQCEGYFCSKTDKGEFLSRSNSCILSFKGGWMVDSNKEAGDGYSDIIIRIDEMEVGIIIEVKYSEDEDMNAAYKSVECRSIRSIMMKLF